MCSCSRFSDQKAMTTESQSRVRLEESWRVHLIDEFDRAYMQELRAFLLAEATAGRTLYPPAARIFRALDLTPLSKVKVVIIGQDPYHGPGQAEGLCFSVASGVSKPPSLINILKEVASDFAEQGEAGEFASQGGSLVPWAEQGVLLLNAVLTVEQGRAASHRGKGWERFTDRVVEVLNEKCEHLVFMLWGSDAKAKGAQLDGHRHLVLSAPHPSPFSADRGFFGCRHFSRANRYLGEQGKMPIDWFQVH